MGLPVELCEARNGAPEIEGCYFTSDEQRIKSDAFYFTDVAESLKA